MMHSRLEISGFVLGLTLLTACRSFTYVQFTEAERVGAEYFQDLIKRDFSAAMGHYSSEFCNADYRPTWASFLQNKQHSLGDVLGIELIGKHFVPRTDNSDKQPAVCFIMEYRVKYSQAIANEQLTLCSDPADKVLRIAGHNIEKDGDAAHRVSVGLTFKEVGVSTSP